MGMTRCGVRREMKMQYGDELEVLRNGPLINAKTLQSMGISDGATCWGLWTNSDSSRNPNRKKERLQIPHLMIAPMHPDLWPIAFQLRVILRDEKGSISQFLKSVEPCPIEVQFSECTFAGYDQMGLNMLCTFSDLIDWKTQFLSFYLSKKYNSALNRLWSGEEKSSQKEGNDDPCCDFLESIIDALDIPITEFYKWRLSLPEEYRDKVSLNFGVKKKRQTPSNDSIRRVALEWIGRQMLKRLLSLWLMVWNCHFELYEKATKTVGLSREDLDPVGSYFFPGKSVQTGRKPWNIEIPFPPIWDQRNKMLNDPNSEKSAFIDKTTKLFEDLNWLYGKKNGKSNSKEKKLLSGDEPLGWFNNAKIVNEELFEKMKQSKDLGYGRRLGTKAKRPTRHAFLAIMAGDERTWVNQVAERILSRNWLHPYTSHASYELAYAAIWRRNKKPVEFRYDEKLGQLVTRKDGILDDDLKTFERELSDEQQLQKLNPCSGEHFPQAAIASFNIKERFFRLRFIDQETSEKQILNIDVKFEVYKRAIRGNKANEIGSDEADQAPPNSSGLLQLLCKVSDDLDMKLLRISVNQKGKYPIDSRRQFVEELSLIHI